MLIAPTVLGQEVSVSTETSASTSTSTASAGTSTSETAASGTASGTNGASSVTSSEGSQSSESAPASPQPQAQTAVASSSSSSNANASSSSDGKAPQAASTTSSSTPAAASSNGISQGTSAEAETPMMEVEQYTVGNKTTELNIKDGAQLKNGSKVDKDTKLIRNRDGEQRDIVDIKREVKTNADGTVDVTVTVTPKEIDKGADVMALLDVSKKMTEDDFNNAKDKIKKLVTTLTSKSPDSQPNHNARNSVRLMTFYRKVNDPIELNADNVDAKLDEVWKKAKEDWDWGVDLQGAIHKAREIFNKGKRKKSGKRQHIVLFSQGESTFSYDINDKDENDTVQKNRIAGKVTTSNPLFPWLPIFNHTNQKAEVIDDVDKLLGLAEKMGISLPDGLRAGVKAIGAGSSFLSTFTGSGLTEYLTLNEYRSDILKEKQFDYTKRVGEGYYYHSYSKRTHGDKMPFEKQIREVLERFLPKIEDKEWPKKFIEIFGLQEKEVNQIGVDVIMKVINSIFYKREYHYYNHNLSAIAEAKMAQKEGITFYSVDVTDSDKASKRVKRQVGNEQSKKKKEDAEKDRNNKFDDYLKKMSEGGNFLSKVEERGKFKDTLTELTIKDEFTNKVKVQEDSEGKKYKTGLISGTSNVTHTPAKTGFFSSNESLTWTISKEQLKKAFEDGTSLTLTYKLKVENDKFKKSLEEDNKKKRAKRSAPTENENSVTEKIISNTTTYKINEQKVEGNKFDDVNLTYSKFKVPVPQIDGQVIEPQAPKLPDLPPVIEHGPVLDYTEESIYRLPLEHGSNAPDTQVTIEEDTVPQRPDILVGGQSGPVDITEDTQPGMSGSNDATVVEEDTAPQRPDILVGGQSDPIDITEDTQPGMSGSNDATVIEEDTKPKRFFHFDNEPQAPEKPKEQPSLSLPQAPVYKAAHHLPASGDKREASFTIVALTIIGAAGLLSKKRRDTEEN
ncbi:TPA: fibronectin binding protein [Streptococcus pyogenes]|nr:fibronectin binding protein [Streptococcus pyogenes]HEQ3332313.1 fibronectin binding protein [Streptococcus pyogenes]HEQ3342276.1 fibronectin binding protein [Streptococcus pyogenes]HEQ3691219.1 fibronectin binding protein [Streptococcus pyogenes]HEQ3772877.1 fibronectin binding protein [Streptococcus pyogenes]